MAITGSFDHRAIDGATGAEFLKTIKELLESPAVLLY
jgi:pyruvate dehydrogenase E2 component (dihydrolipoamide acetyltransferase)